MRPLCLLAADDDFAADLPLRYTLRRAGIAVEFAMNGADLLVRFGEVNPDIVLVDVATPVVPGADVVRALARRTTIPLLLGAVPDAADGVGNVDGLAVPITKPYHTDDLLEVISELAPLAAVPAATVLTAGAITVDLNRHEVTLAGQPISLALKEFVLLQVLMDRPGRVVGYDEIHTLVWGRGHSDANTLFVHIKRLRHKLGDDAAAPRIVVNVRGLGYRLDPPPAGSR